MYNRIMLSAVLPGIFSMNIALGMNLDLYVQLVIFIVLYFGMQNILKNIEKEKTTEEYLKFTKVAYFTIIIIGIVGFASELFLLKETEYYITLLITSLLFSVLGIISLLVNKFFKKENS